MNLKQLETFSLIAELGSLSRVATATGTAQSLVSRQLAQLESEWGDRLFERTGRGMVLSEFGRRVRPEVELLLIQLARLEGTVKDASGVLTGTVHFGVLPSMSRELLPMLFADLRALAPLVRLHVTEGFSGDLDEQLGSGRLDMIIVNRYGAAAGRGEDVLGRADTYLAGKPQAMSALGLGASVAYRALSGLPLVLPSAPNGLRTMLDMLERQRRVGLDIVMEVDTLTAMKDVAMSGHAFTLLPMQAIKEEVDSGRLAAARLDKPALRRTVALSFTRQRPLSRAARLVGTRAREMVSALLA
ncbi:MAG: LysR family transcriptional regulator [Burkholderiaceae bacterium]